MENNKFSEIMVVTEKRWVGLERGGGMSRKVSKMFF